MKISGIPYNCFQYLQLLQLLQNVATFQVDTFQNEEMHINIDAKTLTKK